ncbi:Xaa-Pro aminopeptidase 1 [Chionoecetes opilio]|uniref:Xaa-Pro aminopeptidase 1 n=1 Tax=Chionoecetes opilio TaxID=41210 RepID=A0A8J4YVJ6_CHIOP|nr:Xaa-Pro aminopeptidase 1 [Chionoecetes opilio]
MEEFEARDRNSWKRITGPVLFLPCRVAQLREEMLIRNYTAYIVPINGEQDGYTMEAEKRLGFLTGYTGSAGMVVVTRGQQALWTDGRYFLQAEEELDCDWLLMKEGQEGVPEVMDWLKAVMAKGEKVAADPKLVASDTWKKYDKELRESGVSLVTEEINLVDLVWSAEERPPYPNDTIYIHELDFAGKRWEDKVKEVREDMVKQGADRLIVTSPDEVAWLLNLRGNDVTYTPVFRGYAIVDRKGVELFVPENKITPAVDLHLNVNQCSQQECVTITAYTAILNRLRALKLVNDVKKVMLARKWSYSDGASYAIYSAVPEDKRLVAVSPVLLMKARKNPTEVQGMKAAHVRDGVAVCAFLSFMEREVMAGNAWDEIEAATKLHNLRQDQRNFMGISFETISAFGPNGAVIHYRPRPESKLHITANSLYLVDSGGQYKDGTTDVTRTLHYGTPTPLQVEAYTRVLMGAVDLATLVFPEGTGDTDVDILARRPLYEVGLDYRHGTGHGIGHFLSIHEAPTQVRIYSDEEHELELGQFFSDEPGYYHDNEWGIRLETILTVVPRETKYKFDKQMLGFEAVTLVPFEAKLINMTLLSDMQVRPWRGAEGRGKPYTCEWVNAYHQRVRAVVGPELRAQALGQAYDWMRTKTEPLDCSIHGRKPQGHHVTATAAATTTRQGHF